MTAEGHNTQDIDEWAEWDKWVEETPPIIDGDTFEAELDQTIQGFDDIQAELSYRNAQFAQPFD